MPYRLGSRPSPADAEMLDEYEELLYDLVDSGAIKVSARHIDSMNLFFDPNSADLGFLLAAFCVPGAQDHHQTTWMLVNLDKGEVALYNHRVSALMAIPVRGIQKLFAPGDSEWYFVLEMPYDFHYWHKEVANA